VLAFKGSIRRSNASVRHVGQSEIGWLRDHLRQDLISIEPQDTLDPSVSRT